MSEKKKASACIKFGAFTRDYKVRKGTTVAEALRYAQSNFSMMDKEQEYEVIVDGKKANLDTEIGETSKVEFVVKVGSKA